MFVAPPVEPVYPLKNENDFFYSHTELFLTSYFLYFGLIRSGAAETLEVIPRLATRWRLLKLTAKDTFESDQKQNKYKN